MDNLFSYVVDHDRGFAPNPEKGFCTLVHCKYGGIDGRRNIVELADIGDWILGTGGVSKESVGHDKIVYLMRVDEKPFFDKYLLDKRFKGRCDHVLGNGKNKFALVSKTFFYFGRNALDISDLPSSISRQGLIKKGPGFRRDYPPNDVKILINWFMSSYDMGMHGEPTSKSSNSLISRQLRKTKCK